MKKISTIILLLFFFPYLSVYSQNHINIQFQKSSEIRSGDNYFFGSLKDIQVTKDFIFISDPIDMKVKAFSKEGDYIRTIGDRGKGPGEFVRLTSMWLSKTNKLFVADYMNAKIAKFDISGELVDEMIFNMEEMRWPRTFHHINKKEYLILYKSESIKDEIFHLWESNFKNKKKSFSLHPEIIGNDVLKTVNLGLKVGSTFLRDSTIIYAPFFYEGKIYSKNIYNDKEMSKHDGKEISIEPYEILDSGNLKNSKNEKIYDYRVMSQEGEFPYWLNSTSKGIFKTENGFVVNFIEIRNGDWKEQGIEVYDSNLNFLKYKRFDRVKIKPNSHTIIPMYPKAMDAENRVYFTNFREKEPYLSIYQLNISKKN